MRARAASLVLVLLGFASTAAADDVPLAELLLQFFSPSNPVILAGNVNPAFSHAAHFSSQANAQETLSALNRGIATQISTFPLGTSSAGFTYTFDPALGVYNRNTETFGPIFSERPLTAGKGKFSVGANYLKATYDKFEGYDLHGAPDDGISLYLTHLDTSPEDGTNLNPWFEGDIIRADLNMHMTNETVVLYANYGIADRFDVGVAVPYIHLKIDAAINTTIERLATGVDPFIIHQFDNGTINNTYLESGSAEGVGDMVVRAKYTLVRGPKAALAGLVDLRLPTGREEDLLGSGATQGKVYLVGAYPGKRFAPRATAGYTFSSGGSKYTGDLPNELAYSAGFDLGLHSRVTLTADFLGRNLHDTTRLVPTDRDFHFTQRLDPTVQTATFATPSVTTGNLNLMLGSAGLKINPFGKLLIIGNVLFPIGEGGLQDKLTPVIGIDYSF